MNKNINLIVLLLLLLLFLMGCQKNTLLNDEITKIEVYDWTTNKLMKVIEDNNIINELVTKLNSAEKVNSDSEDIAIPDYKLLFIKNQEIVLEMGLFQSKSEKKARLLELDTDIMYTVNMYIPIE